MKRRIFLSLLLCCLSATAAFAQTPPSEGAENHAMFRSSDKDQIEPEEYVMRERPRRAADAPVRWLDVTVEKAGELATVLGEQANEIDSLVVRGPINDDDFVTMSKATLYGSLTVINLENAAVKDNIIPEGAFYSMGSPRSLLRRIMLPNEITEFQSWAFAGSIYLEEINLPTSLRYIGERCFEICNRLKMDTWLFPDGMEEIDNMAFYYTRMDGSEIVLPPSVKRIGFSSFFVSGISKITLPEGIEIESKALLHTNLKEIAIPNCTLIGEAHLSDNSYLEKVSISEGITTIPSQFLARCPVLKEISIPTSVESIESFAFADCMSLKVLKLPEGVKNIGAGFVSGCNSIEEIWIPSTVDHLSLGTFNGLMGLQSIYCAAQTPPVCEINPESPVTCPFGDYGGDTRGQTPRNIWIYVPIGTSELYKRAWGWNYFTNFVETSDFPYGSVSSIAADAPDADAPMYDLMGRQITHPANGQLYIQNGRKHVHWDR